MEKEKSQKLPEIIRYCSIKVMKNGRSIGNFNYLINSDLREQYSPGLIWLIGANIVTKLMPSPEAAMVEGLKIIAEKLNSKNCEFDWGHVDKERTPGFGVEQLKEWIAIATNEGKDTEVFYNPHKDEDVERYISTIRNGDLEQFKLFIENGARISRFKIVDEAYVPLLIAIENEQLEVARYILEKLDGDYEVNDGDSYLVELASEYNDKAEEQIIFLLKCGYNISKDNFLVSRLNSLNVTDEIFRIIIESIQSNFDTDSRRKAIDELLKRNYTIELKVKDIISLLERGFEYNKENILRNAALNGNIDLLKYLVETKEIDPNALNREQETALESIVYTKSSWYSSINFDYDNIKYLLSLTSDFEPKIFDLISNLAAEPEIFTLLVKEDYDFNIKNDDYLTPLEYAEKCNADEKIIDYIRLHTKVKELTEEEKNNILHYYLAELRGKSLAEALILALNEGADPNKIDEDNNTILHKILLRSVNNLESHTKELVTLAINKGADVDRKNNKGETPLLLVYKLSLSNDIAEDLLLAGADINSQDNDGNTALHLASFRSILSILHAKPNLLLANKDNITAIDRLRNDHYYYSDGSVYADKQEIIDAVHTIGIKLPTDQELHGASWKPHALDIKKSLPAEFIEVSSYYFPFNRAEDDFAYLGGNRLALVGGYPRVIQIFDTLQGKVTWQLSQAGRNGFAIYDETRDIIYVARNGSGSANFVTAHEPNTGTLIWKKECKLTNSSQQFGLRAVQNELYLIYANIDKSVLFFVNKDTGKFDGKSKMEHPVDCGAHFSDQQDLLTYKDKLYVVALNRKKDYFCLDQYDINKQMFEKTVFTSESGCRRLASTVVDGYAYLLSDSGIMYKISLDNLTINEIVSDPKYIIPNNFYFRDGAYLYEGEFAKIGDTLVYLLNNRETGRTDRFVYDLQTDTIKVDNSIASTLELPKNTLKYEIKDFIITKSINVGDAVYTIQRRHYRESGEMCYLHQLV